MTNREKIRKAGNILLDSVFPRRCPVCGEIVTPPGNRICENCVGKLDFVKEPRCLKCGRGIFDLTQEYCYDCSVRPKSFDRGFALLSYDDHMKEAMAQIKYKNRREYIASFARLIFLRFGGDIGKMRADAMIPVPVHPSRMRSRGYNQAELLARELKKYTGLPVRTDILRRNKKTAAQKKLTPDERLKNLSAAFTASPGSASAGSFLLTDDIYTTGSTIEACTRTLKEAGAAHVFYVSICIVTEV